MVMVTLFGFAAGEQVWRGGIPPLKPAPRILRWRGRYFVRLDDVLQDVLIYQEAAVLELEDEPAGAGLPAAAPVALELDTVLPNLAAIAALEPSTEPAWSAPEPVQDAPAFDPGDGGMSGGGGASGEY